MGVAIRGQADRGEIEVADGDEGLAKIKAGGFRGNLDLDVSPDGVIAQSGDVEGGRGLPLISEDGHFAAGRRQVTVAIVDEKLGWVGTGDGDGDEICRASG